MLNNSNNYGILLNKDIKLYRNWFKQMAKLHGIKMIFRAPLPGKDYSLNGDLEANYYPPEIVYGIFQDHPDQKTLKKMGWVAELQEGSSIIHVPYDLQHLEAGALFTVPSGIDSAEGRVFRVISMQNIMVYPASIACEIALEYQNTTELSEIYDFKKTTQNLLIDMEDDD